MPTIPLAPMSSKAFAPVSLSPIQATKLETMMQQQLQDALLAHSAQRSTNDKLDSDWRFAGSLGQLKTFKSRGLDSFNSSSSWATIREHSSTSTASTFNDSHLSMSPTARRTWCMRRRSTDRGRHGGLSFTRRTVGATIGRRDPLDPNPPLHSFRTFGRIQGNYRDIIDVHYAATSDDFVRQQQLLSPVVIDGAVLHTIRATKDSYLGLKWQAEHSFGGKRDVCFVEMVGYTIDNDGHEIGFVAMASVDVPECPEFATSLKYTRVRMKRTMLVIPAVDAPMATSEIFVMGTNEAHESALVALAQYRLNMAALNDLSLVIDSKNIAKQRLVHHENWVPDANRPFCSICSRKFHFVYRRRHHCRLCGDIVCKTCYVTRAVPKAEVEDRDKNQPTKATVICQTKFCVRCVMSLRVMDRWILSKVMSLNAPSERTFDSSVTYFKRGTNEKQTLDLDRLYKFSASQNELPESDIDDEMYSLTRSLRPSQSFNQADFNAYKLRELSRHGSNSSLCSEPISMYEEKVILKIDNFNHIIAI